MPAKGKAHDHKHDGHDHAHGDHDHHDHAGHDHKHDDKSAAKPGFLSKIFGKR